MEVKKIEDPSINKKNNFNPSRAILIIVAFMIIVWIIWMAISKLSSGTGKNLAQSGFNLASSSVPVKQQVTLGPPPDSFYKNYVKIYSTVSAKENYPEKEYIEIHVVQSNLSSVDITNWKLVNSKGEEALIGKSTALPVGGKVNTTTSTNVSGNDILIVSTGHSPVGYSFRLNSCTGYFEQFQDFVPPIITQCPNASYDPSFQALENDCKMFAYTIPQCTTNVKPFPSGISAGCKSFIISKASYNGCVATNKNNADFNKPEWRIFLNRDSELWNNTKDTVTLLDDRGDVVDSYSYGK